jgi:hypothetical protein
MKHRIPAHAATERLPSYAPWRLRLHSRHPVHLHRVERLSALVFFTGRGLSCTNVKTIAAHTCMLQKLRLRLPSAGLAKPEGLLSADAPGSVQAGQQARMLPTVRGSDDRVWLDATQRRSSSCEFNALLPTCAEAVEAVRRCHYGTVASATLRCRYCVSRRMTVVVHAGMVAAEAQRVPVGGLPGKTMHEGKHLTPPCSVPLRYVTR